MLTEFQKTAAVAVSHVTQTEGFALGGGAALIFQGLVDRRTRDLDFFSKEPDAANSVCTAVEEALRFEGMEVMRRIDAPGFVRIGVSRGSDACEVDLGHDARLEQEVQTPIGPVVSSAELAADKTLALFGRAAARDFVDVHALAPRFGKDRLCELAAQKDPGFDKRHFADALDAFSRLDREVFDVDDAKYASIKAWSVSWGSRLKQRTLELDVSEKGRNVDDDFGLER